MKPRAKVFLNIADPDLRLITMIAAMHCGLTPFALLEVGDLGMLHDHAVDRFVRAAVLGDDAVGDRILDQLGGVAPGVGGGTLRPFSPPNACG